MMIKYQLEDWAKRSGCKFEPPREGDAGYDIYSAEDTTLFPGDRAQVTTGLRVEIPSGTVGIVKDRSSIAMRGVYTHGGVIDASYRGTITVLLENNSKTPFHIEAGHRIAQLLLQPALVKPTVMAESLTPTPRGEGAFGSTGR
jgi:dUTP pyrophosphatase